MKVLSDKRNADVITWMPSGESFSILKPKLFVAKILPTEFKTAKYSSFTRKLHRWGFVRHYRGEEAGAFYHKDFQRGNLELVEKMACHKAEPPKPATAIASASETIRSAPPKITTAPKKAPSIAKPVPIKPFRGPMVSAAAAKPLEFKNYNQVNPGSSVLASPVAAMQSMRFSGGALAANSFALPPMVPQLTVSATNAAATAASYTTDRLSAAIELEVNRRMKERITAMALSRQAFAISTMCQQQLMTPPTDTYSQLAAALLLQKQAGNLANAQVLVTATPAPAAMGYRAMTGEGRPMPGAPPTNIQGARTA